MANLKALEVEIGLSKLSVNLPWKDNTRGGATGKAAAKVGDWIAFLE